VPFSGRYNNKGVRANLLILDTQISRLAHRPLLYYLPENGTWVPKHVGVFTYVTYIAMYHEVHLLGSIQILETC